MPSSSFGMSWTRNLVPVLVRFVGRGRTLSSEREARTSAPLFLKQAKRQEKVFVRKFRDGFFPYQGTKIKEF